MSNADTNIAIARRYLQAIEAGATGEALAAFYTGDVLHEELPNRLNPHGSRGDLAAILAAAERGRTLMRKQTYEVLGAVANGDAVALEVRWTGILNVPFDTLPAGRAMKARFAVFLTFRDGRIAAQRNYDCFEPW